MKKATKNARADHAIRIILLGSALALLAGMFYTIFFNFTIYTFFLELVLLACVALCLPAYLKPKFISKK